MSVTDAAALAGVILLGAMSPGPDFALVLRTTLAGGRWAGFACALGVALGVLGWALAAALGVAGMLAASATAFAVVKLAGAAYLIFLGVRAVIGAFVTGRSGRTEPGAEGAPPAPAADVRRRSAFGQGLLTNLLNPKAAVFFVALLPQFMPAEVGVVSLVELCLITSLVTLGWFCLLATGVSAVGYLLTRRPVRRAIDVATGTVLVGLGLRVATSPT